MPTTALILKSAGKGVATPGLRAAPPVPSSAWPSHPLSAHAVDELVEEGARIATLARAAEPVGNLLLRRVVLVVRACRREHRRGRRRRDLGLPAARVQ